MATKPGQQDGRAQGRENRADQQGPEGVGAWIAAETAEQQRCDQETRPYCKPGQQEHVVGQDVSLREEGWVWRLDPACALDVDGDQRRADAEECSEDASDHSPAPLPPRAPASGGADGLIWIGSVHSTPPWGVVTPRS
jgi:hypothetical protein